MKIGILSLVLNYNFGGILQSYALQTVLERMGHEVYVLAKDRDIHWNLFDQSILLCKFLIKRYVLRRNVTYFSPRRYNSKRHKREQYTSNFINRYIHTRTVRRLASGVFDDMDTVIVGSDQVWRPIYFKGQWMTEMEDAFLKFQDHSKIKRVAYAASFGTDEWEYSEKETVECGRLLNKFDAVSVREWSGVLFCEKKFLCKNVFQVLDPTFLLEKEDYMHLVEQANTSNNIGGLMCYILDDTEEKRKTIDRVAEDKKLIPFYLNSKIGDATAPQRERIQPPVEQWIRGFVDAEFVVTDSFHACVFSIIFNKPFVVIGNEERGLSRFQSLLNMFLLEDHLLYKSSDYESKKSYKINKCSYIQLNEYKRNSMAFLKESLK